MYSRLECLYAVFDSVEDVLRGMTEAMRVFC